MSNRAHSGRCFRSNRKTKLRKGAAYAAHPTRWRVPLALRPFLTGNANQTRARFDVFALAVSRYAEHQRLTGKGAPIRAAGDLMPGYVRPAAGDLLPGR